MVDHINLDLDSFEIEDDDRTLPSYIYDVGMWYNVDSCRDDSCYVIIDVITFSRTSIDSQTAG